MKKIMIINNYVCANITKSFLFISLRLSKVYFFFLTKKKKEKRELCSIWPESRDSGTLTLLFEKKICHMLSKFFKCVFYYFVIPTSWLRSLKGPLQH